MCVCVCACVRVCVSFKNRTIRTTKKKIEKKNEEKKKKYHDEPLLEHSKNISTEFGVPSDTALLFHRFADSLFWIPMAGAPVCL